MKYRKKPVVINATQWYKEPGLPDVKALTGDHDPTRPCEHCKVQMCDHGWIHTLEGGHIVCPGDWIITGVRGERYPCKDEIFKATYDKVEE